MLIYKCSVCKSSFSSRAKWQRHLPQKRHQNRAREELGNWDAKVRAKVLIFVKLPVDKDVEIINTLSNHGKSVITDFVVSSEERPRIVLVRFETRKQLLKVLMSLEDEDQFYLLDGSWCEMKDGGLITELEWQKYLPEDMTFGTSSESDTDTPTDPEHPHHDSPTLHPPPVKRIKMESVKQEKEETAIERLGMLAISSKLKLGLRHHLSFIRKLMEIPDDEYNTVLEITRTLQRSLIETQGGRPPSLKAELCRNWLLKLRYSPIEDLDNVTCTVHVYADPPESCCGKRHLKSSATKFFKRAPETIGYQVSQIDPEIKGLVVFDSSKNTKNKGGCFMRRYQFLPLNNTTPPLIINFLYKANFLLETQTWSLLKCLCCFDTRCFHVLVLAYHWAKTNNISIGKGYSEGTPWSLGSPSGLSWLVIFFFQSEGLIPATRSVLEQPHDPIDYIFDSCNVDLGFSDEDEYAESWRNERKVSYDPSDAGQEKFAHDVFKLFYEFLLFCGTQLGRSTGKRGWILSTRDCERISMDDVFGGKVVDSKFLTAEQLKEISTASEDYEIAMINPFLCSGIISTSNAGLAFEAMKKTGLKLKGYFDVGTDVKREHLELADFLDFMKI